MAEILVVDDEEMIRRMLRTMLTSAGHTVIEACNGSEALKILAKSRPALIVTDIVMPEKEGIETIIEIRRRYGDIKIIAMSGGGRIHDPKFLEFAKKVGASRAIPKPFSREQIIGAVNDLI